MKNCGIWIRIVRAEWQASWPLDHHQAPLIGTKFISIQLLTASIWHKNLRIAKQAYWTKKYVKYNIIIGISVTILGNYLKPLATINLPKSPTFLSIFVKVSKSLISLVKSFLGNFHRHLTIFSGHTDWDSPGLVVKTVDSYLSCHEFQSFRI